MKETKRWRTICALLARCSLFAFVLLSTGCLYWGRRRVDQPTPIKPYNPVWIWSGGTVEKWHAVVITQNWVSGIPDRLPLWCSSCRERIPRARVDSIKIGYHTVPEVILVSVGALTALTFAEAGVCALVGPRDPQC